MTWPYAYEKISSDKPGVAPQFRVHDADDNRVATCYQEENARHVVAALNWGRGARFADVRHNWSCGHVAGAVCATCYAQLVQTANNLAAKLNDNAEGR